MIILLHSTQLPENLGAVSRVMGNFGLSELRLITPCVSSMDPRAIATSSGAEYILKKAKIYTTLCEATSDIHTLIGTCADLRLGIRAYETPSTLLETFDSLGKVGILFGCERSGLSQEDLSYCHATVQIPVNPEFSSMNLSHAVAVMAYEYFKKLHEPKSFMTLGQTHLATQGEKNGFFTTLEHMLDEAGYWRVESKKPQMHENLRNLFSRCGLTQQEIQTLLGMFNTLRNPRK